MTKQEFCNLINSRIVILDGATGTNLQKAGMGTSICPEQWILEHPDVMRQLQRDYVEAGTDILYAPTFTGSRIKLAEGTNFKHIYVWSGVWQNMGWRAGWMI